MAVNRFDGPVRSGRRAPLSQRLGRCLVTEGTISEQHRSAALSHQKENGGLLGQILVEEGFCSREDIASALQQQKALTSIDLNRVSFDDRALALIGRERCQDTGVIPFERFDNLICLAMADPGDRGIILALRKSTDTPVKPFLASREDIESAIVQYC